MAVLTLRPKTTVELGVWAGKSCIPLCLAHQALGSGIVYAIDPWSAEASSVGQVTDADKQWWSNQEAHDEMHGIFLRQLDLHNLRNLVTVIRSKSDDVVPPAAIDLLSLDGNHGEQSLRDAKRFGGAVSRGGLVFVDDIEWVGGFVKEAIGVLESIGFRKIYIQKDDETKNTWGCYQRV